MTLIDTAERIRTRLSAEGLWGTQTDTAGYVRTRMVKDGHGWLHG